MERTIEFDKLTGLMKREAFIQLSEKKLEEYADSRQQFAVFLLDVRGFKAINEIFGRNEGDKVLVYITNVFKDILNKDDYVCRMGSDRFMALVHGDDKLWDKYIEDILNKISAYPLPYEITCHIGIYKVEEELLSMTTMLDYALIALTTVKDSYIKRYAYFTKDLRNKMILEREITGMMSAAINEKQFVVYYQPQYSHSTGMLVGAEALVRWQHPERGLIPPSDFIPIFENNGFITNLDLYVFEEVCIFLRECLDKKLPVVAISTNFSRHDVYVSHFVERLEEIRQKYDIPVYLLHLEITESVVSEEVEYLNEIIYKLHEVGYIVEMDDFGAGFSSLNVLKDVPLDMIKLDMLFLKKDSGSKRGGTILSSIIRMAKWLDIPVIAEGVETIDQADFLRSIGCDNIQGYLYSRPLPKEEYEKQLSGSKIGTKVIRKEIYDTLNAVDFWDPDSLETLIFSNFVGSAAILNYDIEKQTVEVLRVNDKYLKEIGMNLSEKEIIKKDLLGSMDESSRDIYLKMLNCAIETADEQECETWSTIVSDCCGEERFCIRSNVRMIGRSGDQILFYSMIRNVTEEKRIHINMLDTERRFKVASEQVNIYFWEYSVATHEMRPCFRCMRDLGLPPLLTNYPDSAIEAGVFPPEIADKYRDWHRQIDSGEVEALEDVLPLTVGRVPFHVRYTVEFDDNRRPVKAYGSAALVVE